MLFLVKTTIFAYGPDKSPVLYGPYETQEEAEAAAWRVNGGQLTQVTVVSIGQNELNGLHVQDAPPAGRVEPLSVSTP